MNFDTLYIITNNRRIRAFFKESDDVVLSENPGCFHELELEQHIRTPDAGNSSPSDRDGRFEKGNAIDRPQGYASGERHELAREQEKRQQQKIAETINGIVRSHENIPWRLVAPAPLLNALDHFLDAAVKQNLRGTESGDWTGFDIEEMKQRIESL